MIQPHPLAFLRDERAYSETRSKPWVAVPDQRTHLRGFADLCSLSYAPADKLARYWQNVNCKRFESSETGAAAMIVWDDRSLVVVVRGTEVTDIRDIKADLNLDLIPYVLGGSIHAGFDSQFRSISDDIALACRRITEEQSSLGKFRQNIYVTGHSLGAAVATLLADSIHHVSELITFGSPRVGCPEFARQIDLRRGRDWHQRVVHCADIVTRVPSPWRYRHCGRLVYINRNRELINDACPGYVAYDRLVGFRFKLLRNHRSGEYLGALSANQSLVQK